MHKTTADRATSGKQLRLKVMLVYVRVTYKKACKCGSVLTNDNITVMDSQTYKGRSLNMIDYFHSIRIKMGVRSRTFISL